MSEVKHKVNKSKQDKILEVCRNKQLCADEINHTKTYWVWTIQANWFSSEIQFLRNGNQSKPRRVEQFTLFLNEKQILRCRVRINNSSLPPTSKNWILLPSSHPYVDLLIHHTHERVKHSAVTNTLTTLRESFWILKGRQAVKRVLKRCVTCQKLEGLPSSSYSSPDLPGLRVSDDPPFTHTGLDFAGLDFAGSLYTTPDGNQEKKSFLLAFRRFASCRGLPATLITDNAKTFKGSSKEVMCYVSNNRVSWKFIVEKAPWWGGFWERLIQSVKS